MDNWIEINISTASEAVEAITSILYDEGACGCIIEDPLDFLFKKQSPLDWDYVDEKLYNKNLGSEVIIKTYVSEEKNVAEFIDNIKQKILKLKDYGLDIGRGSIELTQVNEKDWANNWKKYYKPSKIGEKIVIKPTWEDYEKQDGDIVVELDPGMAFGTGNHETTSMCICQLEKYINKDSVVYDIGCGSGVLSIVASKLGAKDVTGVDFDEVAVKVSKENIASNNLNENIKIMHGNLTDVVDENKKADVIVANIIADVIMILAKDVSKFMKDDAVFISSGIILDKLEEVKESLVQNNFEIIDVITKGEWSCIVCKKNKK
ncbi:MAG: 50S ribosomal protein L11 methyltransferase [Clostridioides sp.]|jgi:ribosomal protein L11 methyltransferase|nr:50S ribosomal protein L11 methyltransferase [Clostridioides sp.]